MDKSIFKDFCGAASQPVSAFRAGYNMMAQGAISPNQATTISNSLGAYTPQEP